MRYTRLGDDERRLGDLDLHLRRRRSPHLLRERGRATVSYTYDAAGNVTALTYPNSSSVTYRYNALEEMTSVTDWNSNETQFGYDADGDLTSVTFPNTELANRSQRDGRTPAAEPDPIDGAAGRDPAYSVGGCPIANWHVSRDRRRSRMPMIGLPWRSRKVRPTRPARRIATKATRSTPWATAWSRPVPMTNRFPVSPGGRIRAAKSGCSTRCLAAAKVSGVEVYWFDDTGHGECRVPESWRVLWRDGGQWKSVQSAASFPVAKDRFNSAAFAPVTTDAVRLEVQLQKGFSGGILQWRLKPDPAVRRSKLSACPSTRTEA